MDDDLHVTATFFFVTSPSASSRAISSWPNRRFFASRRARASFTSREEESALEAHLLDLGTKDTELRAASGAHEYRVLRSHPLPDDMLLIAGVIGTNHVEHPEVVADRIETAVRAVGDPRRVLAGTDCGFDTAAGLGTVAEEVVWEKLKALRAGADIASRRLFAG